MKERDGRATDRESLLPGSLSKWIHLLPRFAWTAATRSCETGAAFCHVIQSVVPLGLKTHIPRDADSGLNRRFGLLSEYGKLTWLVLRESI